MTYTFTAGIGKSFVCMDFGILQKQFITFVPIKLFFLEGTVRAVFDALQTALIICVKAGTNIRTRSGGKWHIGYQTAQPSAAALSGYQHSIQTYGS
jgi:hypothetical protein